MVNAWKYLKISDFLIDLDLLTDSGKGIFVNLDMKHNVSCLIYSD